MSSEEPGVTHYVLAECDVSRADPTFVSRLSSYFAAKNAKQVDETVEHFSPRMTTYTDTTLGWPLDGLEAVRQTFAQYMPQWGEGRSYPVRLLGGPDSGMVVFTDTPELFGGELHLIGAVDYADGKIVRWADYWDSSDFDRAKFDKIKTPDADYPDPHSRLVPITADAVMVNAATALQQKLAANDASAADLLTYDCVWEDMALRTQIIGAAAIRGYLGRAIGDLPFGNGAALLHIVGNARGGGFEWTAGEGSPLHGGNCALELAPDARISRVTFCYDGGRFPQSWKTATAAKSVEHS